MTVEIMYLIISVYSVLILVLFYFYVQNTKELNEILKQLTNYEITWQEEMKKIIKYQKKES